MSYVISLIIVLGVLIFFHELGHFITARLCGVGVEKFSLGIGPRLFGKKIGITDYRVSAFPLGGYVRMIGEEPDAEIDTADIPFSFTHKHVFKRMAIVASGPLFNILLAVIIFFCFFQIYGMFHLEPVVGSVQEGSPAKNAGLIKDDRIIAVDGVFINTWDDMALRISKSKGKAIRVLMLRKDSKIYTQITPVLKREENLFGETIERYVIGITASADHVRSIRLNPIEALYESLVQTYKVSEMMIIGIIKLIKGDISVKTLGGPIMIAQIAGDQAKQGIANLIYFIAFISINLAIVNFIPIPVLDGGHLMFFLIEAALRRPVSIRFREIAQQAGIVVLILLTIFVFYNDLARIFFNN